MHINFKGFTILMAGASLLFFVIYLNTSSTALGVERANQQNPVIQGEVREAVQDVLVPSATIKLTSETGTEYNVQTDNRGRYKIELPSGKYHLQVWAKNFFPFKRSPIVVSKGDNFTLNFTLLYYELTEINNLNTRGTPSKTICTCAKQPDEEIIKLNNSVQKGDQIFLTFGSKVNGKQNITKYKGVEISYGDCERVTNEVFHGIIKRDKYLQVIITLDKITAKADEVIYDENLSRLELKGNVFYDNGMTHLKTNEIKLDLKTGIFEIN